MQPQSREAMRSNLLVGHPIKEIGDGSIIKRHRDRRGTLANYQNVLHVQRVMNCRKAEASDFGRPGMA